MNFIPTSENFLIKNSENPEAAACKESFTKQIIQILYIMDHGLDRKILKVDKIL